MEADAYFVEEVAERKWEEEWNRDLVCDGPSMNIFSSKLKSLTHEDPKNRLLLSNVLKTLTFHSYNYQLPHCCFRYEI
jgi:hypothetical protein